MSNVDARTVSHYAYEIARLSEMVREFLGEALQGDEDGNLTSAAIQLVSKIGFLGDHLNAALGEGRGYKGGADEWLLPPVLQTIRREGQEKI
jgi:hypothetical protein